MRQLWQYGNNNHNDDDDNDDENDDNDDNENDDNGDDDDDKYLERVARWEQRRRSRGKQELSIRKSGKTKTWKIFLFNKNIES